jgi:hypothetical protein
LNRRTGLLSTILGLSIGTAAFALALSRAAVSNETLIAHANAGDLVHHEVPSVGLCPWRDPEQDRSRYFPTATAVREETLILSGKRLEVAKRLGRAATGEENAFKVYRILYRERLLGSIVARRVRGESGVIELLLAVGADGRIAGAKLQRLREPPAVANSLQSAAWLGAFIGKNSASAWQLGSEIPQVIPAARSSAMAILDAAHVLLVQLAVADESGAAGTVQR